MIVPKESRTTFVAVLAAGFDETGEALELAPHQWQLLKCLGCECCGKTECSKCGDFPAETGQ